MTRGIAARIERLEGLVQEPSTAAPRRVTLQCLGGVEHALKVSGQVDPRDAHLPLADDKPAYRRFTRECLIAAVTVSHGGPEPKRFHSDPDFDRLLREQRAAVSQGQPLGPVVMAIRSYVDDALASGRWPVEAS